MLLHHLPFTRLQSHLLRQAEHLLAIRITEFINHFHRFGSLPVIFHFRFYKDSSRLIIIPDMHSERLDAYFIRSLQHHGTENTQRLGTFTESPFRRTPTAYPRHIGYHFRMLRFHHQSVLSRLQRLRHIQCQRSTPYGMTAEILSIQCNSGIRSHSLKTKEITFSE